MSSDGKGETGKVRPFKAGGDGVGDGHADRHANGRPSLVPIGEAVELTGLSQRTIRRKIADGKAKTAKDSQGRILVSVADLEASAGDRRANRHANRRPSDRLSDVQGSEALAPLLDTLTGELAALRRQNEGLHHIVLELNRRMDEGRLLLQAGEAERATAARELADLKADLVRADLGRRWAQRIAWTVGAVALLLLAVAALRGR